MNIHTIITKRDNFYSLVIDSGFLRDIQEYTKTISQPQNSQNIVLLREIANNVLEKLQYFQKTDLPDDIRILVPGEDKIPFTDPENINFIQEVIGDTTIDTQNYHSKLTQLLQKVSSQIVSNQEDIDAIYTMLQPYYQRQKEIDLSAQNAVLSFIFKDPSTIRNLKQFIKALNKWERALPIYHQIVSAKTPKDIELINIQNGSIDILLNIDLDVAISFTEIIKYALIAFTGYLTYKSCVKPIVATYFGNKELIESEKDREKKLLMNIGETVRNKLFEQHENAIKKGPKVSKESIDAKIKEVSTVITNHIIKGNDIRLLTSDTEDEKLQKLKQDSETVSLQVRNGIKALNKSDKKLLLEQYVDSTEE